MNVPVDSFGNQKHASSKRDICLRLFKRSGAVLSAAFVGCLYLLTLQSAVALPKIPNLPVHAVVSTLPHEIYYYRGRYYPYRYRGAYYGHRYYRYGHWHYY